MAGEREEAVKGEHGFMIEGCRLPAGRPGPGLHVVATPIGNLGDITLRALATLAGVDAVVAEDTRHSGRLLAHFGIRNRLIAYHEHNAARVRPRLISMLRDGQALALISDAGTPVVSDPGMKLVREAVAAGAEVHAVPGPSAAIAALSVSGLASDRFLFAGFAPARTTARRRWLGSLADVRATLILFEAPQRVVESLRDMADVLGDRPAALCRELTKLHEEVLRDRLSRLAAKMAQREEVRGEIALVIAPPEKGREGPVATEEAVREALMEALTEMPVAKAAREVARRYGLSRREVYAMAITMREIGKGGSMSAGGEDDH